jgi:hypothetical protein
MGVPDGAGRRSGDGRRERVLVPVARFAVDFFAVDLLAVDFFAVDFRVVAAFLAAVERFALFALLVAAAFLAAVERLAAVDFLLVDLFAGIVPLLSPLCASGLPLQRSPRSLPVLHGRKPNTTEAVHHVVCLRRLTPVPRLRLVFGCGPRAASFPR